MQKTRVPRPDPNDPNALPTSFTSTHLKSRKNRATAIPFNPNLPPTTATSLEEVSCEKCGFRGHTALECFNLRRRNRREPQVCHACEKPGHFVRDCPFLQSRASLPPPLLMAPPIGRGRGTGTAATSQASEPGSVGAMAQDGTTQSEVERKRPGQAVEISPVSAQKRPCVDDKGEEASEKEDEDEESGEEGESEEEAEEEEPKPDETEKKSEEASAEKPVGLSALCETYGDSEDESETKTEEKPKEAPQPEKSE
ncbi:hypothetical protein Pelo_5157 [Pelomyxa schiedti]|nr:hypothetical protein Pelo_5157 [Pelomyxa schiedti]